MYVVRLGPRFEGMDDSSKRRNALLRGVAIGLALGAGIGVALGNVAIGIGVGLALGAGIGVAQSRS